MSAEKKPHIILIEDNPSDVFLMNVALEELGVSFELTNLQSGADALNLLGPRIEDGKDERFIPDLILLDLNIPCVSGFDILAGIQKNQLLSDVPVAVITSSASPADKKRAAELGAVTYIQKPAQLDAYINEVGGTVKQLLSQPAV